MILADTAISGAGIRRLQGAADLELLDLSGNDNIGAEMTVEFARPGYYTVNGDLLGPTMRVAVRKLRRISVIRG